MPFVCRSSAHDGGLQEGLLAHKRCADQKIAFRIHSIDQSLRQVIVRIKNLMEVYPKRHYLKARRRTNFDPMHPSSLTPTYRVRSSCSSSAVRNALKP